MTIRIECECGWQKDVDDEHLGKKGRCKDCGKPFLVRPQKTARVRESADVEEELNRLVEASQSAASNPAMLRVSYLRYAMAYPKWPIIWTVLLLGSITLAIKVHWSFGFAASLFALCLHWHRRGAVNGFIAGCVNPAQVLSVSPPLIAVSTDLTKGGGEWPVIKVMTQPLHKLAGGMPAQGQRLSTVSSYQSIFDDLDHWDDFHPRLPGVVSSDAAGLKRIFESIDEEDWDDLRTGIEQLPDDPEPGIYRVYSDDALAATRDSNPEDVADLVTQRLTGLSKNYCFTPDDGLTQEKEDECRKGYATGIKRKDMLAVIEGKGFSGASTGMLLTGDDFQYHFPTTGKGCHRWCDVVGAFCDEQVFEIRLSDGERLRIPRNQFMSGVLAPLEFTINEIAERSIQ